MPYEIGKGICGSGIQFIIFFPRFKVSLEEPREVVCDDRDEFSLCTLLAEHFGGYTVDTAFLQGAGPREEAIETNVHRKITVIAGRSSKTLIYFQALQKELEVCSGEEQVFIIQQEIDVI